MRPGGERAVHVRDRRGWLPAAALPVLCAASGFSSGLTNPSRDLIVRSTTPPGSTGKVYGFVYSGLDVGSMVTPVYFGWLLDGGPPRSVFYTRGVSAILTIATVLNLPAAPRKPARECHRGNSLTERSCCPFARAGAAGRASPCAGRPVRDA
jgi:MFS family permease